MPRPDYGLVDRAILEAIQSHPEVPTPKNICSRAGGPVPYSVFLMRKRLRRNPSLEQALQEKGRRYVRTCSDKVFVRTIRTGKWKKVHAAVRLEIHARLDRQIRDAIDSFQGAPAAKNLSQRAGGSLPYSCQLIDKRIGSNSNLQRALERKAIAYVVESRPVAFAEALRKRKWIRVSEKVRCAIKKRIDADILRAISTYPGVPTVKNLSKCTGGPLLYDRRIVTRRFRANPSLGKALERRGVEYVGTCSGETFTRAINTSKWSNVSQEVRREINRRLDTQILDTIRAFRGMPTVEYMGRSTGGPLPHSLHLIAARVKANKRLKIAIQRKGIAYISRCDNETFVKAVAACSWNGVPREVRCVMEKRIDDDILRAMRSFPGVPTPKNLSKSFGGSLAYSDDVINMRIKINNRLETALERRGISYVRGCDPDTFARLAVSRKWNGVSPAVRRFITARIDKEILHGLRSSSRVPSISSLSKADGGPLPYHRKLLKKRIDNNRGLEKALELKKEGLAIPLNTARLVTGYYLRNPLAVLADALPKQTIPFRPPQGGMAEKPQPSVSEMVRRLRQA